MPVNQPFCQAASAPYGVLKFSRRGLLPVVLLPLSAVPPQSLTGSYPSSSSTGARERPGECIIGDATPKVAWRLSSGRSRTAFWVAFVDVFVSPNISRTLARSLVPCASSAATSMQYGQALWCCLGASACACACACRRYNSEW